MEVFFSTFTIIMPMCSEWKDGLLKIKEIGPYLCRDFVIINFALVVLPQKHKAIKETHKKHSYNECFKTNGLLIKKNVYLWRNVFIMMPNNLIFWTHTHGTFNFQCNFYDLFIPLQDVTFITYWLQEDWRVSDETDFRLSLIKYFI